MADYYAPALSYSGIGEILRQQNILKGLGQYGLTPSQVEKYAQAAIAQMYEPYVNRATRMYELSLQDQRARQQLALQQEELDFRKEQAQQAVRASTLGALANIGGTIGLGYLASKYLKPGQSPAVTTYSTGLSPSGFSLGYTGELLSMPGVVSSAIPSAETALASPALTAGIRSLAGASGYASPTALPGALSVGRFGVESSLAPSATTAQGTSFLSSLTSSPYFIPGVSGVLRTGVGLLAGEKPGRAVSSGAGTAAGAYIGSLFPGVGTVVGAILGNVVGSLFGGCIIISAVHGKDSEEVDIARRFRDTFLDLPTLRGYYFIADRVVPLMELYPDFKQHIKTTLVDRLIRFGRAFFADKRPSNTDICTTINFLTLCRYFGLQMAAYRRSNGEVI